MKALFSSNTFLACKKIRGLTPAVLLLMPFCVATLVLHDVADEGQCVEVVVFAMVSDCWRVMLERLRSVLRAQLRCLFLRHSSAAGCVVMKGLAAKVTVSRLSTTVG